MNRFLSLLQISAKLRNVEDDDVGAPDLFHKCFWFGLRVHDLDGIRWRRSYHSASWYGIESTQESVGDLLSVGFDSDVIISHVFKETVTKQSVYIGNENSLVLFELADKFSVNIVSCRLRDGFRHFNLF